jgi:two-component system NtrC family sensor kinase
MMDFARVRPAAKSLVDINNLIEKSLRLARFDKSFQKLQIRKNFTENLPTVFADGDQLQQVFLNLFLNARDALTAGGELAIRTENTDSEIRVAISDNGSGIKSEDVQKIFDPFFTTKPAGKGTGLGLAVCYGIITAHGGKIEVHSDESPGTTFLIALPVATEHVTRD